jgi:16S rRNA (cytosine967-C5)-methyltransferase
MPRRGSSATRARLVAVRVLERVERGGAYADLALHAALRGDELSPRDRALATELVYGTLRWRGRLDWLLAAVLARDLASLEPLVATVLRVGAYQIVFGRRIPARAAVDQSVHSARALGVERAAGLVNAVLRRLARDPDAIALPDRREDPLGHLRHALSLPGWIAARWLELYGAEGAIALAEASNAVPPLSARVATTRTDRETLLAELASRLPDVRRSAHAPGALRLGHGGLPSLDPAFLEGRFTIQDEASQLVVELLDPRPGERVFDVCAAPGTKATAIAERVGPGGEVVASDRSASRLRLVGRDARRLGLANVTTRALDATRPLRDVEGPFDRVLVDAPCSGLGTLRRNPDARWRLRPEDVPRLAATQLAILRQAAAVLRPGGTLVYSTCTLLPEENERVVAAFLERARGFGLVARAGLPAAARAVIAEDGFMRTFPHRHDTDGFFAARLERRP